MNSSKDLFMVCMNGEKSCFFSFCLRLALKFVIIVPTSFVTANKDPTVSSSITLTKDVLHPWRKEFLP